jgi:hypothetical protein
MRALPWKKKITKEYPKKKKKNKKKKITQNKNKNVKYM